MSELRDAVRSALAVVTTLTPRPAHARLDAGHYLEVRPDGTVMVMLRDVRVSRVFLAELADKQMVEQVKPGWWAISARKRFSTG
ncbi:MAG TPA: hypothetical protein VH475_28860 [Tepidisphaeraceae bacterium]